MNKVFLYGSVYNIKQFDKFITFTINSRIRGQNNYVNCLLGGIKVKQFTDNILKGDKVTIEGYIEVKQRDNKTYTSVIVENFYSEKLKANKDVTIVDKKILESEKDLNTDLPF